MILVCIIGFIWSTVSYFHPEWYWSVNMELQSKEELTQNQVKVRKGASILMALLYFILLLLFLFIL